MSDGEVGERWKWGVKSGVVGGEKGGEDDGFIPVSLISLIFWSAFVLCFAGLACRLMARGMISSMMVEVWIVSARDDGVSKIMSE